MFSRRFFSLSEQELPFERFLHHLLSEVVGNLAVANKLFAVISMTGKFRDKILIVEYLKHLTDKVTTSHVRRRFIA